MVSVTGNTTLLTSSSEATNTKCSTSKVKTRIWNTSDGGKFYNYDERGPGKFLEHHYLKSNWSMSQLSSFLPNEKIVDILVDPGSEWWFIALAPNAHDPNFTLEALRAQLVAILQEFPNHDTWHIETGESPADTSKLTSLWEGMMFNCRWSGARVDWNFVGPKVGSFVGPDPPWRNQ